MASTHIFQTPVRIIGIGAVHDDHSVGLILGDDLNNGIPLQIQPSPQVAGQVFIRHGYHLLSCWECVAACSKFFRNISIRTVYKGISFFLATSCYKGYADRNSEALTWYPRSNVVAPPPRFGRLRTTVAKLRRA